MFMLFSVILDPANVSKLMQVHQDLKLTLYSQKQHPDKGRKKNIIHALASEYL